MVMIGVYWCDWCLQAGRQGSSHGWFPRGSAGQQHGAVSERFGQPVYFFSTGGFPRGSDRLSMQSRQTDMISGLYKIGWGRAQAVTQLFRQVLPADRKTCLAGLQVDDRTEQDSSTGLFPRGDWIGFARLTVQQQGLNSERFCGS